MAHVVLNRRRDERLLAYVVAATSSLLVALSSGRVEMAAFGAPFLMALAIGRRPTDAPIELDIELESSRVIEGDRAEGRITVTNREPGRVGSTVELLMTPSPDLVADGDPPDDDTGRGGANDVLAWQLVAAGPGPQVMPFAVRAKRWGAFTVGPTAVRVRDPYSLTYLEGVTTGGAALVALPSAPRLDKLLEPRSSRTTAGLHLARRSLGAGTDFAELQNYRAGDRLRDLNRAATARTGRPIVNRYHPERSGEVIVLLDTFIDPTYELSATSRQAIVVAVRAVWAIAKAHLAAQDRVGVATVGRIPIWLTPGGGVRARYGVMEALLSVGAALDGERQRGDALDAGRIPPAALVVFVSPLWDDRYLRQIQTLQAHGRETAVIHLDIDHLLDPPTTANDGLARRLFAITVADRAQRLRDSGVTVLRWDRHGSLGAVVTAAAQLQARRRAVHVR